MRSISVITGITVFSTGAFAQSDRGTITGAIVDPVQAVVAGLPGTTEARAI